MIELLFILIAGATPSLHTVGVVVGLIAAALSIPSSLLVMYEWWRKKVE